MKIIKQADRFLIFSAVVFVVVQVCLEFRQIAWGTGNWWGEYSLKWGMAFVLFILLDGGLVLTAGIVLWKQNVFVPIMQKAISFRERLRWFRWVLATFLFIVPIWVFQYTPWGLVFDGIYFRILVWGLSLACLAFLFTRGRRMIGWIELLIAVILTSTGFTIAAAFRNTTDYPFSLGWSEGNRLWDYSVLFGRKVYDYPADQPIPVSLDIGRQLVGGWPFIFPWLTIEIERAWIGLSVLLPYVFLGLAAFKFERRNPLVWILTCLWVLLFLKQGPIHPPLVLCAFVVALVWQGPLWLAIPLIAAAGYAAEASRYTWLFAPGMWIGMLELAGASTKNHRLDSNAWIRAVSLGLAGVCGGYFGQKIVGVLKGNPAVSVAVSVESIASSVSKQPLLWYRLFPNATYGYGILAGLLVATFPLIFILVYLNRSRVWRLGLWQKLAIALPLIAFLVVGLIVSVKIGGGGDLHNMDMFLIGLIFAGAIAWRNGGATWIKEVASSPLLVRIFLLLMLVIPGFNPLMSLRALEYSGDIAWLLTLTDAPSEKALDLLPPRDIVDRALHSLREEVADARQRGKVLFMDQRQLLTFGFIEDVPFVPEYEKKVLMDKALSSDQKYFEAYYRDLAARRFSLIITEPLRTPIKDRSYQFGEENNAWVKWVANPTLCYYEPKQTFKEVSVQLLVPKQGTVDCSKELPQGGD